MLFAVREKVLAELELARQAKIIGSPLEAKVVLKIKSGEYAEALKREAKELPSIFIVSQVEIDSDASPKAEMEIKVTKAAGDKCCRCWNYSESVGKDEVYKDLCLRCRDVIKTNSKEAVKR